MYGGGYGAPPPGYGAPPPGYGGYGASPHGYGAPPPAFEAPIQAAMTVRFNPWTVASFVPRNPTTWGLFQTIDTDRSGTIGLRELRHVGTR
jgi:hypothetical protein